LGGILCADAQAPVADFSASPTSGCGPLIVSFKDLSTNSPTGWTWDFGTGQVSNAQNPTYTYTSPGTYTVTMIAKNATGPGAVKKTDYITVFPFPAPTFSSSLTLGCSPATVLFTDKSTPGQGSLVSWSWNFGDGGTSNQQNPSHIYTQVGFYGISLSVTNSAGCSNLVTIPRLVRIVPGVEPNFDFNQISTSCTAPFVINFINQTAGPGHLTYTWDLGNGLNSTDTSPTSISYPTGSYSVTLQAQSDLGCSQSITKPLALAGANAIINGPDTVCINTPVSFTNGSTPAPISATWDLGDGVVIADPPPPKTYTTVAPVNVKVVNKYSTCADSITKVIQVVNVPTPAFIASSPTASCKAPFSVSFKDQTTPTPASWLWDFGDGNTSTSPSPTHQYNSTGVFDVKLTVTSSAGCSNTLTQAKMVQITAPTVNVAAASIEGCTGAAIFPTLGIIAVDGVQSYNWSVPAGTPSSSTVSNPSFTFPAQGSYPGSVTITTNGGCTASANFSATIGDPTTPVLFTITSSPTCGTDRVFFKSTSTPADHWDWDFGDGNFSPLDVYDTVSHAYNKIGTFTASLSVFNNGCQTTATSLVTVQGAIVGFTHGNATANCSNPFAIQFTDTSHIDLASPAVTYSWDFGDPSDPTPGTGPTPIHTYPTPVPATALKTYNVTLTITSDGGACVNSATIPVTVAPTVASFLSPANACRNTNFKIESNSSNPSLISTYSWQLDAQTPGPPGDLIINVSRFPTNGPHSITLYITDSNGCKSQATNPINITGPFASFSATGGCKNAPVTFTDGTIAYPGDLVGPPPAPAAPIVSWSWGFGDGTSSTFTSPPFTHAYADTGFYTTHLQVTDAATCTDTFTFTTPVQVTSPQAFFSVPASFYCPNVPLTFKDSSQGYGLVESWDFGDGSPPSPTPTNIYPTSGQTYTVGLKISDKFGCTSSVSHSILIQKPIAAFTIADTTAICTPLQTMFAASGQFYDSLYWDFGDGSSSTLDTTSHFYNDFGTFTAKLFLQGPGGCLDSASRNVYIPNPLVNVVFSYGPPTKQCDSILVNFQVTPPIYSIFKVSFGDGQADSSGNQNPGHLYRNPSTYTPQLIMSDPSGCIVGIGSSSGPITVLGAVPFFSVNQHAFCDSGTVIFTDFTITNDGIATETYSFGDGQTASQPTPNFNTTHFYDLPGAQLATLTVVTSSNCTESYTDTIRVHQTPHPSIATIGLLCTGLIQFEGSLVSPNPDSVTWAWNFGSGQGSTQQNPQVKADPGVYTVSLKTSVPFGCSDTTSQTVTINPLPVIKGPHDVTTPVGIPVTLPFTYSSNVVNYVWTPTSFLDCSDCANPAASPIFNTEYTVSVRDANGCVSTDSILVKTVCNGLNYFLPNTFSPNGDGVNDVFYPRGTNLYNIQSLRIFNRWGQMVFERKNFPANSASDGWDGTFNGRPAPSDAYVYIVEVVCNNAQIVAIHGDVTLVR
jgi:gliding motility-associated-like protein